MLLCHEYGYNMYLAGCDSVLCNHLLNLNHKEKHLLHKPAQFLLPLDMPTPSFSWKELSAHVQWWS